MTLTTSVDNVIDVGDMAPEFTLPSLQGMQIALSSYRSKRHVVLWFSRGFTCNFCRNYMQSVIDAYPAMQAANIEVIQVSPNLLDSARSYFDAGPPFPFVCDPDKRMYAVYGLGDRGVLEATRNMVISFTAPLAESVRAEVETIRASWMDTVNRNFLRRLHHHALTAIDQGVFIIDKQGVVRYRQIVGTIEQILTGEEMLRLTTAVCESSDDSG
jgi:peroxiredoxin